MSTDLSILARGIVVSPLPDHPGLDSSVAHAPPRPVKQTNELKRLAIQNALRYFPIETHEVLAPEFAEELKKYGHIYMYRFRPTSYEMKSYPLSLYPAKCRFAACMQLMIMNNLDHRVAQYPHELVTYGGNGQVFQNWGQYHLVMKYLSELTEEQTLVMYSGHPLGLFPSTKDTPRCVITNGMMIPRFSTKEMYEVLFAQGNTMYGQMTAGSWCYIGPQGIVHGTTITILNAARKYLKKNDLAGVVYLSSGLGGMSGAQSKAAVICGAIAIIAETDLKAVNKRHSQGWVDHVTNTVEDCMSIVRQLKSEKKPGSIAFHGNVVSLWEYLATQEESLVELASDQTSCHNVFGGGYIPVQLTHQEANKMISENPEQFKIFVEESLRRQVVAINTMSSKGVHFWDYGNSFLLEAQRAGADVVDPNDSGISGVPKFKYPSYVQHIMGDVFSLGFGPFRWICTSCDEKDLQTTDEIARQILEKIEPTVPEPIKGCVQDNLLWIKQAGANKLVVGSQARILYADMQGRVEIAVAFNNAIREGKISAPIVLSRDHHDVSGTDSPFRETSNITDGSNVCADMAVQNVIGDAARGATWVSLHNGGGVGWGEVTNGGFGFVLDGSKSSEEKARSMLSWDVSNGIARRCWGGNDNANLAIKRAMEQNPNLVVTLPVRAENSLLDKILNNQ